MSVNSACDCNVPPPGRAALDTPAGHTAFGTVDFTLHCTIYPVNFEFTFKLCEYEPRDIHAVLSSKGVFVGEFVEVILTAEECE